MLTLPSLALMCLFGPCFSTHCPCPPVAAANATVRLSIRKLKLYGHVEVSLVQEPQGKDLLGIWKRRKQAGRTVAFAAPRSS